MSTREVIYNFVDQTFTFRCPHCDILIQVLESETACCIFRHGVYKSTNQQINPHMPKVECDRLVEQDEVIGCAKPFMIMRGDNVGMGAVYVKVCDYI
jgi:hypothetical protein